MRHAHSGSRAADMTDFERTLDHRGRGEAESIARQLVEHHLIPGSIVHSAAQRTTETASILREAFRSSAEPVFHSNPELYVAGCENYLSAIADTPATVERLMLIGHNPTLEMLVSLLTQQSPAMAPATVVQVRCDLKSWSDLSVDEATESFGFELERILRPMP